MSLRSADVERLRRHGYEGFFFEDEHGYLRLHNVDGRCIFLGGDGHCAVYPWRPEGCVLYPLILYTDVDEVGLHDFCRYRYEFHFTAGDEAWLRRGIAREDAEVAARRSGRPVPGVG
jgi:Fe-S-cluster containining protein